MPTTSTVTSLQPGFADAARREANCLLEPIYELAATSESLLVHRHTAQLYGTEHEITRLMLLGQRGGGRPIRVAVFGGLDAGSLDSIAAEARLFAGLEAQPSLVRDFALFGYPIVDVFGFASRTSAVPAFLARFARGDKAGDVEFFQREFRNWSFDGLISLRTDFGSAGFYAAVRSEVVARAVAEPALATLSRTHPVQNHAVRFADMAGRLAPLAGVRPYPFQIEIFAPGAAALEVRISGFAAAVQHFLQQYRQCISHAQNL